MNDEVVKQHGSEWKPRILKLRRARIRYKKVLLYRDDARHSYVVLVLCVPKGALLRMDDNRKKQRVSKAMPLRVCTLKNKPIKVEKGWELTSIWDMDYIYKIGKMARPKRKFDMNVHQHCGSGIHCYAKFNHAKNH